MPRRLTCFGAPALSAGVRSTQPLSLAPAEELMLAWTSVMATQTPMYEPLGAWQVAGSLTKVVTAPVPDTTEPVILLHAVTSRAAIPTQQTASKDRKRGPLKAVLRLSIDRSSRGSFVARGNQAFPGF